MQRHWRGPISSERAGPYPIEFSLLLPCCKTGSRPGVQWLLRHDLLHRDTAVDTQCKALVVACRCGHPGFVQYMFETFYPSAARLTASNCEIVCAALESGNREVVEYVFDANGLTFGDLATDCRWAKECAFIAACAGANLKLAEWLCRRVFIDAETLRRCSTSVLVRACGEGRVDVLAWLRDKFKMTKKTVRDTFSDAYAYNAAFLKACKNNQLGAVRWLVRELNFNKNDVERYSFLALRNACTCGGGLETARFLAGEFGLAGELQKSNFDRDRRTLVKEARHSAKSDFEGTPLYSFMRDELRIANEELRSHILY